MTVKELRERLANIDDGEIIFIMTNMDLNDSYEIQTVFQIENCDNLSGVYLLPKD